MIRNLVLAVVLWTGFAYVTIMCVEVLVFGRFEWTRPIPGVIGLGIGFTFAQRVVSVRPRES